MKYIIEIHLEHKNDVFRKIEIPGENSLEDLHNNIISSLELDKKQMASFYLTNEKLELLEEIPLFKIDEEKCNEMSKIKINTAFSNINNQLIYIYDFLKMWRFLVTCCNLSDKTSNKIELVDSIGKMPKEAPEIIFQKAEEDNYTENILEEYNRYDETEY